MVGDIILVIVLLIYGVVGCFLMGRVDKYLDKMRKERYSRKYYYDDEDDDKK